MRNEPRKEDTGPWTGLRITSLEVTVPSDEGQWIHTPACVFFLVTSPHSREVTVKVSIPVTHALCAILTWESNIHGSTSNLHSLFYFPPISDEAHTFPLLLRFFVKAVSTITPAQRVDVKTSASTPSLGSTQTQTSFPHGSYPLLFWKCVVFVLLSYSLVPLFPSCHLLLASLLWKQLKNQEVTFWNPVAFPWFVLKLNQSVIFKMLPHSLKLLPPVFVGLATFYCVPSLSSQSSLHSPHPSSVGVL